MTVKYQDYKKYEGRSTIKFGDVVDDSKTGGPPTTPPHGDSAAEEEVGRGPCVYDPDECQRKSPSQNNGPIRIEGEFEILDPDGSGLRAGRDGR